MKQCVSGLYPNKLLQLCSDGANVVKSLQKKTMQVISKDMVKIGMCDIYKTHNACCAVFENLAAKMNDY